MGINMADLRKAFEIIGKDFPNYYDVGFKSIANLQDLQMAIQMKMLQFSARQNECTNFRPSYKRAYGKAYLAYKEWEKRYKFIRECWNHLNWIRRISIEEPDFLLSEYLKWKAA